MPILAKTLVRYCCGAFAAGGQTPESRVVLGRGVVAGDPVGMLGLSPAGVLERDLFVWRQCRQRGMPVVMLTAGGYTRQSAELIATTVEHLLTDVG